MNRPSRRAAALVTALTTALASALLAAPTPSAAQGPGCSFVTSTINADVGAYSPFDADALVAYNTDLIINCPPTRGVTYSYAIALGTGASGSYNPRTLRNGADTLNYNIYSFGAYLSGSPRVWGDGSGNTMVESYTGVTATGYVLVVVVPPGQNIRAGTYTDNILITLNF